MSGWDGYDKWKWVQNSQVSTFFSFFSFSLVLNISSQLPLSVCVSLSWCVHARLVEVLGHRVVEIHSYDKPVSELHIQKMYRIEVKTTTGLSLPLSSSSYVCMCVRNTSQSTVICVMKCIELYIVHSSDVLYNRRYARKRWNWMRMKLSYQ